MPSLRDYLPGTGTAPASLDSLVPGQGLVAAPPPMPMGPDLTQHNDLTEAAGMTEVGKGFRSGRLGSDANYLASQEFSLRAAGRHDEADAIRNQIGIIQQRAGVFAPRVQKVEDAWANPTDAPAWLGGVVGQVGSSMVDSVATGVGASKAAQLIGLLPHPVAKAIGRAGSWIGAGAAAVPNVLNARGETANQMVEDPTLMANTTAEQRNDAAWLSGGAQGLVDTAMPSVIINRLGGAGIAKGVHKLPLVPRIAADMVGEGTQEVIQEGMKKGTLSYLNPNRDTSGDASDYLNSSVSGLGMTPHSAASIAVDNAYRRLGVKGDGQRGDDIDLSGKDITTQLKAAASKPSSADSVMALRGLLSGNDDPDLTNVPARQAALLGELAKRADPKSAELSRQIAALDPATPEGLMGLGVLDDAFDHLAPRLGMDNEQLAKKGGKLKNSLQVDRYDFGKGQIDTSEMPARTPEQQAAMAEAAQQHKTQTSRLRSLLENTYTQMHADAGTKFNPSIKKLLGNYAPELAAIMSPGVAEAPTAGEIARAKRIGSSIGSALGDKANGALVAVAQRLGVKKSPVFDAMHDEAVKVAEHRKSGGHAAHAQHMMERDAAALALLDAAPEFDARMAKKEGVDLRLEGNAHLREQLLSHMEDHADGEGSATQAQLEEQFGKEAYAKMMEIVGGPIAPRHTAAPKATEQKASPKPKLSSDDITDGETSDYEKRGHEKSHTAVDPGSLVFGHSQTEARSAADAFKPGADGKLMKLIPADRVDSDGRRSLNVMQLRMAQALRSQSKGYVYGRQKDGKVGTSAKELMDRQGVHGDQRVALMGQYLAQENPGADHTDFVETVKALPALRRVDELMSEAVQGKPLSTPEMSRSMRGQLKRVMNYVANPEQFLSTDVPLSAPARAAQNLAIAKAVRKAHADMRGMIDGHESLAPMVAKFKATHGRAPSTHELADHFFGNRFLVHAEKLSDRDYLKIDNDEFTALHREGTRLLRAAEHQAHESGGNVDEHKAGMNLIHFRSLASTQKNTPADQKTVAIPAHKLVRWVRDMRNKHTKDMRTGDNTRSYSDNSEAEQYLADLTEGINALMTQKLVRGKPWIVNAAGEREHFGADFDPAAEGDAAAPYTRGVGPERVTGELAHMHRLGHQRMGDDGYMEVETPPKTRPKAKRVTTPLEHKYPGGIPPSLSVGDGRTFAEMKAERGKRADEKLEEEIATRQAKPLGLKSMGEAVADHNAMHERDAKIGQDEVDMQDADHVRESEEMMSGSKRDREERDHQWKMTQVTLAAADRLPEALTKITAFTKAKRVAERLWRDYIGDKYADPDGKLHAPANAPKKSYKEQTEAHARAVGAILSYVTATERTEYDPTDENKTRRGDHFIAPLAALLTPNHMAAIGEHYPNELKKVSLLRAKTASVLLHMAYGGQKATITAGQLKQAVDSLTGYADAKHDLAQAQAALARADGAEEKQRAQAAITAAKSASPAKETEYRALLTKMAQPYFELSKERGYKTRLEEEARLDASKNPDRERHFVTPFVKAVFGDAPVDAPALTAEQQAAAEKFDETGKGVEVKRVAPALSVAGSVGASDSGKVSIDTTPKPRAISRKPKADPNITVGELRQARAERPVPAGDYYKTRADTYSEVAADTAAAEQGADNVAALAGALAQSARSQKTTVERRGTITRADVRAEPNTLFVFGDNDARKGLGGQAAAMRGEPNAVGVRTKGAPSMGEEAFWSDANYAENIAKIDEDFERIARHDGPVVVPTDGLGTGRAQLAERAPRTLAYLNQKIAALGGVVAKRENNATIADAAAKLNAGATIQQVNAGIAAKRDAAKRDAAPTAQRTINIWHGSGENAALSNLADRPFQFNGRMYVSVEHGYQTNKSGKFDQTTYDKYTRAGVKIPGKLGAKTEGGWNLKLMKRLVSESFKSNPDAMEKLLATGDAKLTHTQDRGVWAAEFPRILTEVRSEAAAGDTGLIAVKRGAVAYGGQPAGALMHRLKSLFTGAKIEKAIAVYQTVEEALKAAGLDLPHVLLSVKTDRLKLEGMDKQWFQSIESKLPVDLVNKVMALAQQKKHDEAKKALIDYANGEASKIEWRWKDAYNSVWGDSTSELYKSTLAQVKATLERQSKAFFEGAMLDPLMERAIRQYSADPQRAAEKAVSQLLEARNSALDEIRYAVRSPVERHYVLTALDKAMSASAEFIPDANERMITATLMRLAGEPTSSSFLVEYDKTANLMDKGVQHKDDQGGVWRKYEQTTERGAFIDDGAGGRVESSENVDRVSSLTSRAFTTWCTSKGAASYQLRDGDFWVYSDKDGKTQLAARMNGGMLGEIQDRANDGQIDAEWKSRFQWLADSGLLKGDQAKQLVERANYGARRGAEGSKEERARERKREALLSKMSPTADEAAEVLRMFGYDAAVVGDAVVIRGDYHHTEPDFSEDGDPVELTAPIYAGELIQRIEGNLVLSSESPPKMSALTSIGGKILISREGLRAFYGTPAMSAKFYEDRLGHQPFNRHFAALLASYRELGRKYGGEWQDANPLDALFEARAIDLADPEAQKDPQALAEDRHRFMKELGRKMPMLIPSDNFSAEDTTSLAEGRKKPHYRPGNLVEAPPREEIDWDEIPFSKKDGQIQGFYDPVGKKSYLIADGIASGTEMGVVLHEVGVHMGMEKLLGAEKYQQLIGQIKKWETSGVGQVKALAQQARARLEAAETADGNKDHELLAYFVEAAVDAGIDPTKVGTSLLAKWMNQVWAAVKDALSAIGWDTSKLTARDVVALAYGAARLEMGDTMPSESASKTPVFDALPSHKPGQKTMTYAGIGSRRTTPDVLRKMTAAAKQLAAMGYTLMSGGAQGADSAFEQGAEGKAQVFKASDATDQTRKIAKEIHPNPGALGIFPLNLMARNTNQIFGADLKTPVDFVLTWTPDGAESTAERSIATGGTGQAIDMASRKGIPVINMAKPDWQARVRAIVRAEEATKDAVKNSLQTADTARALTPEEIKTFDKNKLGSAAPVSKDNEIVSTRIALRRMLGDKVKTLFEEIFPDMQGGADWNETKAIIRIATASSVPMMQRGYHEAMHAFYSLILKNSPEAQAMIERVTSDPKIIERMAAMLKDSPEAVEQMRTDAEERAAYAYQFWAAGMLDIGKKPETFFEKVQAFMRRVLGAVRESDKALAIFTAFHDGKLTEPSAAGLAITKVMETGEWRAKMLKRFDKQAQAAYSEVMATINVGMNSESPTARTIAMMFYSHPSVAKTAGKPGYIDSAQLARHQYENLIQAALRPLMGDNLERDMAELAQVLNGKAKAVQPHVEKAAKDIYAALHRFHKYAREAGVDIGVRDATEDSSTYFPRVIQLETMIEEKAKFIDMLVKNYPSAMAQIGQSLAARGLPAAPEDAAAAIHQSYIDRGGIENAALNVMREDGVLNPFFASQNERKLHWIRDEHIAPFLSTDVVATLTRYFSQGTRSAEYVRRFGEDGQKLKDMMARVGDIRFTYKDGSVEHYTEDGPVAQELRAAAAKAKAAKPEEWVNRRMEDLQRSFGAMEGSLGKDISAGYRQFQGNIMTYQVLRTLPLSLFSAMLDPNGLRVAGGTSDDMWYAYKRGLLGVFNTWKDLIKGNPLGIKDPDKYEVAANAMGVIAPTMYLEQYGGVHSSEYSAGAARKINHKFFLANGLTSWDRDMRIAATKAAMESIVSNEANTIPAHSARWLKELGLQQGDGVIRTNADGELVTNKHVLAQMRADEKGTTKEQEMEQAEKDAHKIAVAVNRWVARAIIAPNAALRPSRASDPHYAMFFQLKSFTYAFTETTLKYAMAEAEEGNLSSSLQLLRGVPIMIAADMTKAVLTNGGSLPGYMANWTMADWVLHGLNRSGNLGTPQLALDALHGAHGPIVGAAATVGGPTVSQVIDLAAGTVNGNLGTEVAKSIPLFNKIGPMAHTVGGMLDMGE